MKWIALFCVIVHFHILMLVSYRCMKTGNLSCILGISLKITLELFHLQMPKSGRINLRKPK